MIANLQSLLALRLKPAVEQWQSNRRLRIAAGLAMVIASVHLAFALGDSRVETVRQYRADHELRVRLDGAASEEAWFERAGEAEQTLEDVESSMVQAAGAGEAQAELQARLTQMAGAPGLSEVRVRSEAASTAEGLEDVWEVVARLDAVATPAGFKHLLGELSRSSWIRIERIELVDGSPGRAQVMVRAYFRRSPMPEASP